MSHPCHLGFICPYLGESEDYAEVLCCYPDLVPIEDKEYPIAQEVDCPLMADDSELEQILYAYNQSDTVQIMVERVNKEYEDEVKSLIEHMKQRKAMREQHEGSRE